MFRTSVCLVSFAALLYAQENTTPKPFAPGEYERYSAAVQEITAGQFAKAVADLDAWAEHDPDSQYKNERQALFVQAYAGENQAAKALDAAAPLLRNDLKTLFAGAQGQAVILRLLYSGSWAITRIANPTAEELSAGEKAARELLAADTPLPGIAADKWAEARADMKQKATAALVYIAMVPGMQSMKKQPPDCAAAERAYTDALRQYPDQSALSYELARALACGAKENPGKEATAIYEFERATVIDPTLGGRGDAKQVTAFADSLYTKYHGSDEGLEQLRALAKTSAMPPADFMIRSAEEIARAKQEAFEAANPELALWAKVRAALVAPDGEQYFESDLKGTGVPQLAGTLLEAKPACRPRELLVSMAPPDSTDKASAEIELRLDKPLAGRPEPGTGFRWEGVPSAFSKEPFLLTMDTESSKISGLETSACPAAPARRPAAKP